jgi:hypothetical protein
MPYKNPIPTREEWQKLRDNAKVPKGAAKVSIGDSIAKVHKSFTPDTVSANVKDTEQLIANLDAYINQTKAKYPAFEAIVKTKVRKQAANHLSFLKDIVRARTEYYPRYTAAMNAYKEVKAGKAKPKAIADKLEQLRGCVDAFALFDSKWTERKKQILHCHVLCGTAQSLTTQNEATLDAMFKAAAK